jgi:hypothetical protein
MTILFFILLIILFVFSYGFIDPGLILTKNSTLLHIFQPMHNIVYVQRPLATVMFALIIVGITLWYLYAFFRTDKVFPSWKKLWISIGLMIVILVCSFSAFSYDLFNYITTAKVAFHYHENPYIVMPTQISNEPYLSFTRAANKVALYGPVWIGLTALPHAFGLGQIWNTIITFKLFITIFYLLFLYFIYRLTKSKRNVVFFAFNPLIIIEVLVSGHNDIVMMFFAMVGLYCWHEKSKIAGLFFLIVSWFTKIPSVVLAPLLFLKKIPWDQFLVYAYGLLSFVFFVFAPMREELYPWYAVWMIVIASFFDLHKRTFLIGWTMCLSFALELRNLPYIYMGYYGGSGPMIKMFVTIIPLALYLVGYGIKKIHERKK